MNTTQSTKRKWLATALGLAATAVVAPALLLAGPAQADIGHHDWVQHIQQHATVGSVTPTFGNGR
jgi:hypothetical protein